MKTIILTVEIKVDDLQIARKYPNFGINYGLGRDNLPSAKSLMSFARSQIRAENSLRDFGFSVKITDTVFGHLRIIK